MSAAQGRRAMAWAAALLFVWLLFFFRLTGAGLLGPDEPRYAAIGREMAQSGDWITPRLWDEPWFEKPPLLYWMTAAGFTAGLGDDLAPRLPVALAGAAFLLFYFRTLRREFSQRAALFATVMLGASAGWLAFSHVAVTDLPMTAAFSAAMLLALRWVERGESRGLLPAAALLGLAVLAKGLVPVVLALPLFWMGRRRWRDLGYPALVFLVVSVPWFALVTARHGSAFLLDFFWKQHLQRFATEALQHEQPWWFYLPVLLALLYPWTPALALLFRRPLYKDPRAQLLLLWAAFGLVFFSASTNKLPGYLLPLLPPLTALLGLALDRAPRAGWMFAGCGALLGLVPLVPAMLPQALLRGVSHTQFTGSAWIAVFEALTLAAAFWVVESSGRRTLAVLAVLVVIAGGVLGIETRTFPALDRTVSARAFWRRVSPRAAEACVGDVTRSWRYGLNYYAVTPLPDCSAAPRPLRIDQDTTRGPRLAPAP